MKPCTNSTQKYTLQKNGRVTLKPRFRWAKSHAQRFLCWVQPEYTETSPRSQVQLKSSSSYAISYIVAVPQILKEFWPTPGLLFRPIQPIIATSRLPNFHPCAANSAANEDINSPWTIWGLTELRARAPRPHSYTRPKQKKHQVLYVGLAVRALVCFLARVN